MRTLLSVRSGLEGANLAADSNFPRYFSVSPLEISLWRCSKENLKNFHHLGTPSQHLCGAQDVAFTCDESTQPLG